MKAIYFSNAVWPVADNISIWVTGAIYLVGLLVLGPKAGITVGTIVAMTGYSGRFWQPIMNLSNLYNTFINTIAYLERIFETMDEPVTVTDKENAEIANKMHSLYSPSIHIAPIIAFPVR